MTRRPASASSAVATRPARPAPTTITSASMVKSADQTSGAEDTGGAGPVVTCRRGHSSSWHWCARRSGCSRAPRLVV
jgi:hypothetical protein